MFITGLLIGLIVGFAGGVFAHIQYVKNNTPSPTPTPTPSPTPVAQTASSAKVQPTKPLPRTPARKKGARKARR